MVPRIKTGGEHARAGVGVIVGELHAGDLAESELIGLGIKFLQIGRAADVRGTIIGIQGKINLIDARSIVGVEVSLL